MQNEKVAFAAALTKVQSELKLYIAALSGNLQDVEDILQETNVYILERADTYDSTRPFLPWAKTMAKFQVLRWKKTCQRSRIVLDESALDAIPDEFSDRGGPSAQMWALRQGLRRLSDDDKLLLRAKYADRLDITTLARNFRMTTSAVVSRLFRIRRQLQSMIRKQIKKEHDACEA